MPKPLSWVAPFWPTKPPIMTLLPAAPTTTAGADPVWETDAAVSPESATPSPVRSAVDPATVPTGAPPKYSPPTTLLPMTRVEAARLIWLLAAVWSLASSVVLVVREVMA